MTERPEERESLSALEYRDRLAAMAEIFNNETALLEADWKADHDTLSEILNERNARIKQMGEAIREALNALGVPGPGYPAPAANAVEILRAALSPSDTEKPRRPRIDPATGRVTR